VSATPTPLTDSLGKGLPKQPDFYKKVKEIAEEYGTSERAIQVELEKELPYMAGPPPSWENGTGQKFLWALRRFEVGANFSRQTGMTPNEAIEAAYKRMKSMKSRESEVASALGIPNYEASQIRKAYLASAEERRNNIFRTVTNPHQRMIALQKFDEELKQLRAEDRRGGKKRKTRTSKKSARKTRRRA
jgi:hypothetical protein